MADFLAPFLFALGLAGMFWLLSKQGRPSPLKRFFWPVLLLHLLGAISFIGLYLFYFQKGDVLSYHRQAIRLNEIAQTDWKLYLDLLSRYDILPREPLPPGLMHWGNPSSWLLVKIISGLHLLNRNNLWLTALAFGGFSFWGKWKLISIIQKVKPDWGIPALVSLFLVPSVLFWTSGIGKETLFWGGLCLFLSALIQLYQQRKWLAPGSVLSGLPGLWISWQMRYFVVAILLLCLLAWAITVFISGRVLFFRSLRLKVALFLGIMAAGILAAPLLHPNFRTSQLLRVVVKSNQDLQKEASEEDQISYNLRPELSSLIENSPKALVAALFRPWLWEAGNLMKWIAAVENAILFGLLLLSIYFQYRAGLSGSTNGLLKFALWTFVIVTAVFLSLATPVFGSLHRYRSGFLPFYVFLLLTSQTVIAHLNKWFIRNAEESTS